ncbi:MULTISPECIES: hypothetical protein [unclassified Streptomyces]|uniref:Uncharacterized protein n=1 Tax=Streptomyces sp. R33 TaxID=3238629 RepID=A0AB39XZL5_9ACTN|nr:MULTISPECIES: hypothetical protein [unclassified Streptomyces]TDU73589.1 hypothetical protein EDD91_0156 [Streptomyces sp. KS 21]
MTVTKEELIWATIRMLGQAAGMLLLLGIAIIITAALAVTIKEHTKPPR